MKYYLILFTILLLSACSKETEYDASGRFEADDVIVSSESSGKLISFDVEEGMPIKANVDVAVTDTVQLYLERKQLAAQLESQLAKRPDIKDEVASLRRQIAKQKKEKERFTKLVNEGAAAQKQLDDICAELEVLERTLDGQLTRLGKSTASINSGVAAMRVRMEQIDDLLSKCHVQSPINGVVLDKYVECGEFVQIGKPLFKVADMNNIYLRSYFTSDQLAKIKLGDNVRVVADYGGDERHEYKGIIRHIASESEFTPKTIQTKDTRANLVYAVKIAVKNDGRLKIGLTGEVYL